MNAVALYHTVDDYLHRVLLVLVKLYRLFEIVHRAVDANTDKAALFRRLYRLFVPALLGADDRRKNEKFCTVGKLHYPVDYLIHRLTRYLLAADGAVRRSAARVQQSEIVIYLGNGADGRARVL